MSPADAKPGPSTGASSTTWSCSTPARSPDQAGIRADRRVGSPRRATALSSASRLALPRIQIRRSEARCLAAPVGLVLAHLGGIVPRADAAGQVLLVQPRQGVLVDLQAEPGASPSTMAPSWKLRCPPATTSSSGSSQG